LIIPNARVQGAVASDSFFKVFLNTVGTDEFVELEGPGSGAEFDYDIVTWDVVASSAEGETVGIVLKPGLTDPNGVPYSSLKKAQVVIALRALRRDYSREVLKTTATAFESIAGGVYGPENPAAFAMQKVFEADPTSFAYMVAVDEITDGEPDGTYGSYLRALELAATVDVYTVFVPTTDRAILNAVKSHVLELSAPEGRKERIGLVSTDLPTQGPDEVQASGIGDLKAVAAFTELSENQPTAGSFDAQVQIFSELEQAGQAPNTSVFFSFVNDATVSAPEVEYAGGRRLSDVETDGTVVADGSIIDTAVDPATSTNPVNGAVESPAVNDFVRFTLASVAPSIDDASQTIKETGRNFKESGVKVNDRIDITDSGWGTLRFIVTRILTGDDAYDTLEVAPVGHTNAISAADTTAYAVTVNATITKIDGAGPYFLTTNVVFDFNETDTLNFQYISSSESEIVVNNHDDSAPLDSWGMVNLLNTDIDVGELASFYVGDAAVRGVPVIPDAYAKTATYNGGSDLFNQFYTNADIRSLNQNVTHFLDLESENRDPEIISWRTWNGSVVVQDPSINPDFPDLTGLKVNESYGIYIEGATLTIETPLGTENDLQSQAETLALFPERFRSRRIRAIWPDVAFTEVAGTQVEAPGYYLGATLAGLVSTLFPEQGHSELPIPGWTRLEHSNDYFKESQLEIMTAAGWWIYVQDETDGPIVCRKQYTTDVSGDITAEASFTTIADNFQKDVRNSVKPLLGVNNITPDLVDRVRLLIQSVGKRYQNRQAIKSYTLNSLEPSTEPGDLTTLVGDITLEFYGPFNLLRIRVNL
jgi:hypothetical protein